MKSGHRLVRRPLVQGLAATALVLGAAAWLARPRVEQAIRARITREAVRRGLVAQVEGVHVGLWPLVALTSVRVEKPGTWALRAETLDVTLRLRGSGLLGRTRLSLGRVRVSLPAGLTAEAPPTRWDVAAVPPDGFHAELRDPTSGLAATWFPAVARGRLEVSAAEIPAGQVLIFRRDGLPLLDPGFVAGSLRMASDAGSTTLDVDMGGRGVRVAALSSDSTGAGEEDKAFGLPTDITLKLGGSWRPAEGTLEIPRWRLTADGAVLSGALTLADIPFDPRVDLSLEVERVDLARLLGTSGLDQPEALATGGVRPGTPPLNEGDLGSASLSARVRGRVAEPGSFTVSQRLDFVPPRRNLPALQRLRGDFEHEVILGGGARKTIRVSPECPDFIAFRDVPPLFVRTLLLGEDSGFFSHRGIDLSEVPSAILTNWTRGGVARGASTITQQLAKNLFLSREKRLGRKLQELSLALLLEATLSKERMLEIYLNVIEWGPDLYGLRPAARRYFHQEPRDLSPKQMAFLVALIPGPVKYQRSFANGTLSSGFRPLVDSLLGKLRSVDALSEEEYQAALGEELVVDSGLGEPALPPYPPGPAEEEPPAESRGRPDGVAPPGERGHP